MGLQNVVSERPSRSEKKRHSLDLQVLGRKICALPVSRRKDIGLPERLQDAVEEMARTRSFEGQRRQLQFVGKTMTLLPADEIERLRFAVAQYELGQAHHALELHEAESWRDRLLQDEDAFAQWMDAFPQTDTQHLRSLIRAARKQGQELAAAPASGGTAGLGDAQGHTARHGKSYRELFQHIKSQLLNDTP